MIVFLKKKIVKPHENFEDNTPCYGVFYLKKKKFEEVNEVNNNL